MDKEQFDEYDREPARDLEKKPRVRPRRLNVDYVKKDIRLDVDMEQKY